MRWPEVGTTRSSKLSRRLGWCGGLVLIGLLISSCGGAPTPKVGSRYHSVRPGVAFEMLTDNPELVVLDVRSFADYSGPAGHLERAVSAPWDQLDTLWPLLELSREDTVLLYSRRGGDAQAAGSAILIARGLRYVVQIDGGLEDWSAEGFAVRIEDAPISPPRPPGFQ